MRKLACSLIIFFAAPAFAQTAAISGYCNLGATKAATSGLASTNYVQGIIPSCTVTVYLTGTTTKATIYSDANNTALSNPFTASSKGAWQLFATNNQGYDVVGSGGTGQNTYPSPQTICTACYPAQAVLNPSGGFMTNLNPSYTGTMTGQNVNFSGSATASSGVIPDKGAQVYNVYTFGAVSDGKYSLQGSMTSGSAVLTCTDCAFSSADVGKTISVQYAGTSGNQLVTTIASYTDAQHVTLTVAASSTTPTGAIDALTGVSQTPTNGGTSGYLSGSYSTTNNCSGSGASISFISGTDGTVYLGTAYSTISTEGSGYTVGCHIIPTVSGSSGDAYFTVTQVDGAGVEWGTNNLAAFQSWMAACGGSKNCYIPYGNFLVDTTSGSVTVPSNTKVTMDRQGVILWVGSQTTGDIFAINNVHNVDFQGLHTKGENLVGENPSPAGPFRQVAPITLFPTSSLQNDITVADSNFENSYGHGVGGGGCNYCTGFKVTNSRFWHNNNTGVNVNTPNAQITNNLFILDKGVEDAAGNIKVDSNTFLALGGMSIGGNTSGKDWPCGSASHNNVINPAVSTGLIITDSCSYGTFADNTIIGFMTIGMQVLIDGFAVPANNETFIGNHLCGAAGSSIGILIVTGTGHKVLGNTVDASCGQNNGYEANVATVSIGNHWAGGSYDIQATAPNTLSQDYLANGKYEITGSGTWAPGTAWNTPSGYILGPNTPIKLGRNPNYATAPWPLLDTFLTGYHGNSSDVKVQYSDGTGTSGHYPKFDGGGGLTDSGFVPGSSPSYTVTGNTQGALEIGTASAGSDGTNNTSIECEGTSGFNCGVELINHAGAVGVELASVSSSNTIGKIAYVAGVPGGAQTYTSLMAFDKTGIVGIGNGIASADSFQVNVNTGDVKGNSYAIGGNVVLPSTLNGSQGSGTKVAIPVYGTSILSSGTVTVSNSAACTPSATCVYRLDNCAKNASTGIGTLSIGTISVGTSFVINSLSPTATVLTTDASTVCWSVN